MDAAAQLIDEIRELDAKAAGKRMQLALMLGERDEARRYMREMNAITEARRAAVHAQAEADGSCYFTAAAHADAIGVEAHA
jgi:hypothetical protein